MADDREIIGAFSEDQVARLTGLTRAQLQRWNRIGFIRPAYYDEDRGRNFRRIYSFRDLLKLRVLGKLYNEHKVPLKELRHVERELAHMGDDKWTKQRLWVLNRRVVFQEPESTRKREISSKQFVAEIPLAVVTRDAREEIKRLNERTDAEIGQIHKKRNLHSSQPVFKGTRIPVDAVLGFLEAGHDDKEILRQFPDLRPRDIDAARRFARDRAA